MNAPLIRNWQTFPIPGGWGVDFYIGQHKWEVKKSNPLRVVDQIARIQRQNGAFVSMENIWDYCNAIWVARSPDRAITPKSKQAERASAKIPSKDHWQFGPEKHGPILWFWLHSFGMSFDKDDWLAAIDRIGKLLDPDRSPLNGCDRCFREWNKIIALHPPSEVNDEEGAARWSYDAHAWVNKKLEKRNITFFVAAKMYGWKVTL